MTTITESSLRSKGAAIVGSSSVGYGSEPGDVVEAAIDVAALGIGLALIAKQRPDRLLVIKAGHQPAAHLLEEGAVLDSAQDIDAVALPSDAQVIGMALALGCRVHPGNPVLDVLGGLGHVIALDGDGVIFIRQMVMRVDVARHLDERRHGLGLERCGLHRPGGIAASHETAADDET